MNAQEVFDKVVAHLRTQRQKAVTIMGCRYRTPEGLKCAVGCLIEDNEYHDWMEGMGVDGLLDSNSVLSRLDPHRTLLAALQCAHDGVPIDMWEEELRRIAEEGNLVYTPPEKKE